MGMEDLANGSSSDDAQSSGDLEQSKTLIANLYSTDQDDRYKDVTSWDWFDSTAYEVTRGGGMVRRNLKKLAPSGQHEEWYTRFQLYLAHYIGELVQTDLPNGDEPQGPVPLMEFLGFEGEAIVRYLEQNPDEAEYVIEELGLEVPEEMEAE